MACASPATTTPPTGRPWCCSMGWPATAASGHRPRGALADRARVVAIDARGHGRSERRPADLSPEAHVGDAAFVIEELRLGEAIVVGQSYGGLTAFLLAAERPDLVSGLVVIEATPASDDESVVTAVEQGLRAWPVPFRSRAAAVEFFEEPAGEAWAGGLEQRADGWWPRFDVDVMAETLRGAIDQSRWDLWGRIRSPTLVVRGENGALTRDDARAMADALAETRWI